MKKLFLSFSVLASLLVAGCSSDDAVSDNETDGQITTHYMCVNIVSADGGSATRTDPGSYEDGSQKENKVSNIRFYFFTENGAAANVKLSGNSYLNYYDWPNDSINQNPSTDTTNNIESLVSATIVINTQAGDQLPRSMVAILNPDASLTGAAIQGLTKLREVSYDYAQSALTQEGKFVMANSVYGEGTTSPIKEVCPVYITNDNICETVEEAKKKEHAVTIYVERNVAKVKVSLDLGSDYSDGKLKLTEKQKDGSKVDITVGGTQVYLQLNGWALTAETDKSYLTKRINPDWESDWWNEGAHRCTWAVNANGATNRWIPTYNSISKQFGTDSLYTNENAQPFSDGTTTTTLAHTKFIVKGKLCDASGNALTLVRHLGSLFADTYSDTESNNLLALKANILSYLQSEGYHYWKENGNGRTEITAGDIEIEPNTTSTTEQSKNNCYVHAKLTTDAAASTWYTAQEEGTTVTADVINAVLGDKTKIGEALVWRSGQTYYYAEIVHRNYNSDTPATSGVVRNHIYKVRINGITGLGTPVYDPGQVIYPEKPNEDDHYIAATIDILSWRVISDAYTLDW